MDRTGRIYSDVSAFLEHSIKTNHLELISRNLFSDVGRVNEDLKYFTAQERRRISNEILGQNSRRENRSGTVNFVPPVNKFDSKLKNYLPIIDTPIMIGKSDPQISPILDVFIQNNNEDDISSNEENSANSRNNNTNNNSNNNNFLRNIQVENFRVEYNNTNEEDNDNKKNNKLLGLKTKRNKNKEKKNNKEENDDEDNDDEDNEDENEENENTKKNKKKK